MRYNAIVKKQFRYMKVYSIKRSVKGDQNAVSRYVSSLLDKYLLKKKPDAGV
ncbi:MAG: hypothetical protein M1569_00840 [Candidatus Marsarchaeota archaeon]|nr:hypothetical protein [Candidatus Marsarchaeota archaeon]MCL5412934.1 hypothetical protein [Candidatus Marsarchaeota archaeon]